MSGVPKKRRPWSPLGMSLGGGPLAGGPERPFIDIGRDAILCLPHTIEHWLDLRDEPPIFHQYHDLGDAGARELMAVGLPAETPIVGEDLICRFPLRHRQDFPISQREGGSKLRDPNGIRES